MRGNEFLDTTRTATEAGKVSVNFLPFGHEAIEKGKKLLPVVDGNIAEKYVSGDAYFRIGVVWGDRAFGEKIGNYHAILQRLHPANDEGGPSSSNCKIVHAGEMSGGRSWDKFQVLIDVCHSENGAESVIPSVVWFEPDDLLHQIRVDAGEFAGDVGIKAGKVVTGRKVDVLDVRLGG